MSIETSTRCSCGAYVQVSEHPYGWYATCPQCYDPTEDGNDIALFRGKGETINDALWDWQEKRDDALDMTIVLTDMFGELARQVSEERERQRGWKTDLRRLKGMCGGAEVIGAASLDDLLKLSGQFGDTITHGPGSA